MKVNSFDIMQQDINELYDLVASSDCITIHIPNSDENKDFFDKSKLSLMKNDAILINTARGNIVNEKDLFDVIKKGKIRSAFDVFWEEPYYGILRKFHPKSFCMSPHVSSTCSDFLIGCKKDLDILIEELKNH